MRKRSPLLKYNSGFMPMGAISFTQVIGMPAAKISAMTDSELSLGISAGEIAAKNKIPGASTALSLLKQEQMRRGGVSGDNTKLYLLLGGAGLAAAWFFFIRKK